MSYKNITTENDFDFAVRLTKEHKVASIPVSAFNEPGFDTKVLRFCFAKTDESLKKAAAILCTI